MNSIFYLQIASFCKSLFSPGYLLNASVNTCKFGEKSSAAQILWICLSLCFIFLNIMSILALVLPFYMIQIWDIVWSCIYGVIYKALEVTSPVISITTVSSRLIIIMLHYIVAGIPFAWNISLLFLNDWLNPYEPCLRLEVHVLF